MEINFKKSGILLHNRNKIEDKIKRNYAIEDIPIVNEYKYLGIYIDTRLTFNKHLDNI